MTNKAKSAAQIIKAIGNPNLRLFRGEGYWYFEYEVMDKSGEFVAIYETKSVYCMYLNSMTLEQWVEYGRDFVAKMEFKL